MSDITKLLGQRIRNYRTEKGWSQEKLAELAGCHPTYIGQIERAEKNATIESIEKIGKNSRKFVEQHHNYIDVAMKYIDFWRSR